MGTRTRTAAVGAATALACLLPAAARAETFTVGHLGLPPGGSASICGGDPCTAFQGQVSPAGGYTLRVPADGTITSWSYRNGNVPPANSYSLRVLRPSNPQETSFTAVASSASPPIPDANDSVRGPYAVSIAVRAGDRIGLRSNGPNELGVPIDTTGHNDPATGDGVHYFSPDVADGGTATPASAGNTGQQVLVQATVQTGPPPPFVPPPPPPAPDFQIVRNPPGQTFAYLMRRRQALQIPLVVQRINGSSGPIALSVSRPPKNTTVTLSHTTVDGVLDTPIVATIAPKAPGATPGSYKLAVRGTPSGPAAGPAVRGVTLPVNVLGQLAVRVEGIEVTQSVQTYEQPYQSRYTGVPLVRSKKTVARVFADLLGTAGRIRGRPRRPEVGMALYAFDSSGRQLPFSPILPDWTPPPALLSLNDEALTLDERVSPDRPFTFELPGTWTKRGPIRLTAVALGSAVNLSGAELCTQTFCGAQPVRNLYGVAFRAPPRAVQVNALAAIPWNAETGRFDVGVPPIGPVARWQAMYPVPLRFLNRSNVPSPVPRFREMRAVSNKAIWEATRDYDNEIGRPGDYTMGVFVPLSGKFSGGVAFGPRAAVGESGDPLIVAHEGIHLLGFRHADSACGGGGGGFPDPQGRLRAVGLDTTEGSGGGSGSAPYRVIADTDTSPAFDVMSYCGGGWISPLNWRRALDPSIPRLERRRPLGAAPSAPSLSVQARIAGGVGEVVSVRRATGPAPAAPPDSAYRLVTRDRAGAVLGSTPVAADAAHTERPPGTSTSIHGVIAAAGVARVEIVSGGTVVAARDRSPDEPDARITAPAPGARVAGASLTVTWRTNDADPGVREVALEWSADGGRTFAPVFTGPDTGRARVPVHLLAASASGRLRLRVNDGFSDTEATSGRIVVPRRRPRVEILGPPARRAIAAGSVVTLEGAAEDDRGRTIRGRGLRWFAGRRLLGRGEQVSAVLPAGTRTVRLVATDRSGRTGSARRRLRVRASTPFFLRLRAPARLSRRARTLRLVVAATQPATLRVRGRRFAVGRNARRISVPVPAGRRTLRVGLTLSAGGKRSPHTLLVRRR